MKDKKRFAEYLVTLSEIYGSVIATATIEVYWQALQDHDDDVVYKAIAEGVKYHWKYHVLPVPAQINDLCEQVERDRRAALKAAQYEREMLEWRQKRAANRLEQHREFKKLSKPVLELVESVAEKMDVKNELKPGPRRDTGRKA